MKLTALCSVSVISGSSKVIGSSTGRERVRQLVVEVNRVSQPAELARIRGRLRLHRRRRRWRRRSLLRRWRRCRLPDRLLRPRLEKPCKLARICRRRRCGLPHRLLRRSLEQPAELSRLCSRLRFHPRWRRCSLLGRCRRFSNRGCRRRLEHSRELAPEIFKVPSQKQSQLT